MSSTSAGVSRFGTGISLPGIRAYTWPVALLDDSATTCKIESHSCQMLLSKNYSDKWVDVLLNDHRFLLPDVETICVLVHDYESEAYLAFGPDYLPIVSYNGAGWFLGSYSSGSTYQAGDVVAAGVSRTAIFHDACKSTVGAMR